jgi:hypothetical protein
MQQLPDPGKSMNEICRELSMSKRTVHSYKQRVVATGGVLLQSLPKSVDLPLPKIVDSKLLVTSSPALLQPQTILFFLHIRKQLNYWFYKPTHLGRYAQVS